MSHLYIITYDRKVFVKQKIIKLQHRRIKSIFRRDDLGSEAQSALYRSAI